MGGLRPDPAPETSADALRRRLARLPRSRLRLGLRPAGVLVPLFWRGAEPHTVFTRRAEHLRQGGQVSFPGGGLRPGEDTRQAALREAEEELGIPAQSVQVLGALPDAPVLVTGFCMTPWVGLIPPDTELRPDPGEVARAFEVPLPALADPARTPFRTVPRRFGGRLFQVPYFEWEDEVIWGATGRVALDLLRLLGLRD